MITMNGEIQLDLISENQLENMGSMEKIQFILDSVKENKIVILESGLDPDEEAQLVEVTMSKINPEGFSGLEIESYPEAEPNNGGGGLFSKVINKTKSSNNTSNNSLTVIGPSGKMETLEKDESVIKTLVSSG